ncbi:MAG: cyanophycinase [Idiomarina sp.]|nr:cyanophycinase [Idiomarina sp.]
MRLFSRLGIFVKFMMIGSFLPISAGALAADKSASSDLETRWNLMLVGGSMNTCSSMSARNCVDADWIDSAAMRVQTTVTLSEQRIAAMLASPVWQEHTERKQQVTRAIRGISRHFNYNEASIDDFSRYFREVYPNLWRDLSNTQWLVIRDHLQTAEKATVSEVSNLSLSKQPQGAELFATFAARAKEIAKSTEQEPLILVVTASGRDSFDAVDFYLSSFREFGVRAQWLPIDAAFGHAVANDQCAAIAEYRAKYQLAFDRERVYPWLAEAQQKACETPSKLLEMVANAQGLFINGGDQSLTRQAFYQPDGTPSAWLRLLQQRVAEGAMVAGGTSAGTAIMPALAMISNGTSHAALTEGAVAMPLPPAVDCERDNSCAPAGSANSLTYRAEGGIGLFPFGLLDTHFSERGRQARLLQLLVDTEQHLAVGVDETTALLVDTRSGDFKVQGAHGVFMLSHASAELASAEGDKKSITGRFTYLRNGSSGTFSDDANAFTSLNFNPQPQVDSGASGNGDFLRDRSISAALSSCGEDTPWYQDHDQQVTVLLAGDQQTHVAHAELACEVALGVIHFQVSE